MKRFLFVLTALVSAVCVIAQGQFYVVMKDGTAESYPLDKVDSLTFDDPSGAKVLGFGDLVKELSALRNRVDSLEKNASQGGVAKSLVGLWVDTETEDSFVEFNAEGTYYYWYYDEEYGNFTLIVGQYVKRFDDYFVPFISSELRSYNCDNTKEMFVIDDGEGEDDGIVQISPNVLTMNRDTYVKVSDEKTRDKAFQVRDALRKKIDGLKVFKSYGEADDYCNSNGD